MIWNFHFLNCTEQQIVRYQIPQFPLLISDGFKIWFLEFKAIAKHETIWR